MGRPLSAVHGTYSMYVNQKCRCEPCSKASQEYVQLNKDARYLLILKSEQAIERERQKRREEKQIEQDLKNREDAKESFDTSVSPWAGLCGPVRESKQVGARWFCPTGICSR